jgi:hypothetical protein
MTVLWSSYKNYSGPLYKGSISYNPTKPLTEWQKILGVIADCEGKFDTVCMHDGTGVTAGFMQWTFTSGRLQKLLDSLRYRVYPDLWPSNKGFLTIYDVCLVDNNNNCLLKPYGFTLIEDRLVELSGKVLDPVKDKDRIIELCVGQGKELAESLLDRMVQITQTKGVVDAQIAFAEKELKEALRAKRTILGEHKTLEKVLDGSWNTPAPALFFNLYQNNPKAAMKLFVAAADQKDGSLFDRAWKLLEQSIFGNWSYSSPDYKKYKRTPRIERIKKAIDKYYV